MKCKDELRRAVVAAAKKKGEKKFLSCADALNLASKHSIAPKEIGKICDEEEIKIHACQLGCF